MPLFDDADFAALTPTGTARYTLSQVRIPRANPQPVVLVLKPSGEANEPYQAALKAAALKGKLTDRHVASLFARHVITGWEHVAGPYTPAHGEELLHRLIEAKRSDIVRGLFAFAADPDNFLDAPAADADDLGNG